MKFVHPPIFEYTHPLPENELRAEAVNLPVGDMFLSRFEGENPQMSWIAYYRDRVNDYGYFLHFMDKYAPFLDKIEELWPDRMYGVAEFGCGMANTCKYLAQLRTSQFYCYDIDPDMLALAEENMRSTNYDSLFHIHDITQTLPNRRYDIVHSHGVLEHFSDMDIENIFYHQTQVTDHIVHYVPTDGYETPSFGDERLMSPEKWAEILSAFDVEMETFNDGLDLMIWWSNPNPQDPQ